LLLRLGIEGASNSLLDRPEVELARLRFSSVRRLIRETWDRGASDSRLGRPEVELARLRFSAVRRLTPETSDRDVSGPRMLEAESLGRSGASGSRIVPDLVGALETWEGA
jgi:hypothetical protein